MDLVGVAALIVALSTLVGAITASVVALRCVPMVGSLTIKKDSTPTVKDAAA